MTRDISDRAIILHLWPIGAALTIATLAILPGTAYADEAGVSFWLPGQFASLSATPQVPGWSMAAVYYHTSVGASGTLPIPLSPAAGSKAQRHQWHTPKGLECDTRRLSR